MPLVQAVRAEVTLAVRLMARHRSMHLSVVLAATVLALALLGRAGSRPGGAEAAALVIAGSLGVVAAARLLGSASALGSLRFAAAPWWLPPAVRLVSVGLLLVPIVAATAVALVGPTQGVGGSIRLGGVVWVASTACAAGTFALAPFVGEGASGILGLLAVWFGGLTPTAVHELFDAWRMAQRLAVLLWNSLPLGWRAMRWVQEGGTEDAVVLASWIVIGIAVAGWGAARLVLWDRSVAP